MPEIHEAILLKLGWQAKYPVSYPSLLSRLGTRLCGSKTKCVVTALADGILTLSTRRSQYISRDSKISGGGRQNFKTQNPFLLNLRRQLTIFLTRLVVQNEGSLYTKPRLLACELTSHLLPPVLKVLVSYIPGITQCHSHHRSYLLNACLCL